MNPNNTLRRAVFGLFLTGACSLLLLLSSCEKENIDFSSLDSNNVENETIADGIFSESEDLTSVTVASDDATGGRMWNDPVPINVQDPRLSCAQVLLEIDPASTVFVPKGVLTIDFGAGCTDNRSNIRKGIIRIQYSGRRFLPNSFVVTTLENYEVNGIKIEGVRTITNTSASTQDSPSFTTTMDGGKITWPDGSTTLRDERKSMVLKKGTASNLNEWWVSGSATGKNRNDREYSVTISKKLVYRNECVASSKIIMPVQGIKELVVDSKKISIDYGNGTCDRMVTVTIRSKSKEIELTGNN